MKMVAWCSIFFLFGMVATAIFNMRNEPTRINGPDFTAFLLRDIFSKKQDGCSLYSVSGSSDNGGEWKLDYSCPNGNIQSPAFTNSGEEK